MTADDLPEDALSEKFLAATGPGGQNVNKVATACQLRCDVFKLGLSPDAYARLKVIAGSKLTTGGELLITARRYRTQEGNRADARERLAEMITAAHIVQAKRRADQAQPFGQGQARRREKGPQRDQGRPRESEFRLMYDFKIAAADKPTLYRDLAAALDALVAGEPDAIANMANAAALIWETLPDLNWAGFYRNVGGELVLGPFQGRAACIRIPFGKGVCGAAAATFRSSASTTSMLSPAISPATPRRTANWSCRSFAKACCSPCSISTARSPARFDAEDEVGCVALGEILARAI